MNKVHLSGNLTRDVELKYISTGKAVVNFGIAVNRYYKKNDEKMKETTFLDCEAWDTGAEAIEKFFKKGDPIIVHGSLKQETWERDDQKMSRIKVRVEEFEFPAGKKRDDDEEGSNKPAKTEKQEKPTSKTTTKKQEKVAKPEPEDEGSSEEDEVPF